MTHNADVKHTLHECILEALLCAENHSEDVALLIKGVPIAELAKNERLIHPALFALA